MILLVIFICQITEFREKVELKTPVGVPAATPSAPPPAAAPAASTEAEEPAKPVKKKPPVRKVNSLVPVATVELTKVIQKLPSSTVLSFHR